MNTKIKKCKNRRRRTCRRRTRKRNGGSGGGGGGGGGKSTFIKRYNRIKTLRPVTKEQILDAVKQLSKCVRWIYDRSKLFFLENTKPVDGAE